MITHQIDCDRDPIECGCEAAASGAPHRSHPDQLMASVLGACWHSPTSDRWPCQLGYYGSAPCNCGHAVPEIGLHNYDCPAACGHKHGSGEICAREPEHGGQHHSGGNGLGWESE